MASQTITLPSESDTVNLATKFAQVLVSGDTILLSGDIGAGKSAFSRALIRAKAGAEIDVPSPTYTLVQTYDVGGDEVWHCDLYRLTSPEEAFELGLDEAFETAICLIEWPDRLGNFAPAHGLSLHFEARADGHAVTLSPNQNWVTRLGDLVD